jgi:hypothetical protein
MQNEDDNMRNNAEPSKKDKTRQKHIADVYRTTRELHNDVTWQEEAARLRLRDDVDVFYIVELFAADVAGYAQSIIGGWRRESPETALKSLKAISIFENHEFCEWYFKESQAYPNFVNYVQMNDYLRLLVIEDLLTLNHCSQPQTEGTNG